MSTYSKTDRLNALQFAREVEEMASKAPNDHAKRSVYAAVNAIRLMFGFGDDKKKAMVAHYVRLGCSSYEGLVRETRMHRPEVVRIVQMLSLADQVRLISISSSTGGRPSLFIQPAAD